MSELSQVFQEGMEKKQPVPGGPFLIQMLFREAPAAPSREQMARVFQQHCGQVECFVMTIKWRDLPLWTTR